MDSLRFAGDYYLRLLLEEDSREEREGTAYSAPGIGGTTSATGATSTSTAGAAAASGDSAAAGAPAALAESTERKDSTASGGAAPATGTGAGPGPGSGAPVARVSEIIRSAEFFNDLYHRFLLTPKQHLRMLCLQAMAIVYGRHYSDIGPFNDTKYIVMMLERVRSFSFLSVPSSSCHVLCLFEPLVRV